jgi:hypothetical protein
MMRARARVPRARVQRNLRLSDSVGCMPLFGKGAKKAKFWHVYMFGGRRTLWIKTKTHKSITLNVVLQ